MLQRQCCFDSKQCVNVCRRCGDPALRPSPWSRPFSHRSGSDSGPPAELRQRTDELRWSANIDHRCTAERGERAVMGRRCHGAICCRWASNNNTPAASAQSSFLTRHSYHLASATALAGRIVCSAPCSMQSDAYTLIRTQDGTNRGRKSKRASDYTVTSVPLINVICPRCMCVRVCSLLLLRLRACACCSSERDRVWT